MNKLTCVLLLCVLLPSVLLGQIEICDNGIDDDLDGLIDINDPDCICEIIEPESVIPNPSFEDMECCPNDRSQLDCASLWIQASEPTTDYIHTCGWLAPQEFPPPRPFPDGEGIMGFRDGRVLRNQQRAERNWKEYAGACLISPLLANESYRFQFDVGFVSPLASPPIDITFFGTSDCSNLPFGSGNEALGCPTNGPNWKKLGEVRVSGGSGNRWVNAIIQIMPDENIAAIAIGPSCNLISNRVSTYYFFDNLLLANLESFNFRITENLHPCNSEFSLSIPFNPAYEYQWYKSGIALSGENSPELSQDYGEGTYQVRILDDMSCRLSSKYEYVIPEFSVAPEVSICEGESYQLGDRQLTEPGLYTDTLKTANNCDSFVTLQLSVLGIAYDTVTATVINGGQFEIGDQFLRAAGEHQIRFPSSLGCDSLVLVELTTFDVFIPTAFSPNLDGVNDSFRPFAPPGEIQSLNMRVFNRWGGLVYEGLEWDGNEQEPGVYVYTIDISFPHGNVQTFKGAVTLIR